MTVSIIQKSADQFTDATLAKLGRDPRINAGSVLRLDFTSAFTLNGAAGAIGAGAVMKNMVDNQPDMTFAITTGVTVVANNKGINNSAASVNSTLSAGFPSGSFDMHDAGDHAFIFHAWFNQDATGQLGSANVFGGRESDTSPIWGATPSPLFALFDSTGLIPGGYVRAAGGANQLSGTSGAMVGAASLMSFAWTPTAITLFQNGAQVATAASPMASSPSQRSHATLTASANPADGDTVTVNGTVFTFKTVVTNAATQVPIGTTSAMTLANLNALINANKSTLIARAEVGSAATIANIFRQDTSALTLTTTSSALAVSAITAPYALNWYPRGVKGTWYGLAIDDLTLAGLSPAQAAAGEYAATRAMLTAAGIA